MRILLVDDHKMMREGLRAILSTHEHLSVVGEASDGYEAAAIAQQVRPQIVIMDISMPGLNGVDATRRLVAENVGVKVIGLSMNADRQYVLAMFQAGAAGYLLKSAASTELLQAIHAVSTNLTYLSPSIAADVVDTFIAPGNTLVAGRVLSQREREVLQLIAEGCSSKTIAKRLRLATSTVETHRRQLMDKLQLRTVAELTKYAVREGLTSL